jgi:hypothetical protein
MLIDVNSPLGGESIDRSNPSGSYTSSYLNRTFAVVEAFKSYPNTLLFFSGNEVINDLPTGGPNPPYMRVSPQSTNVLYFLTIPGRHKRSQELHCQALHQNHPRGLFSRRCS